MARPTGPALVALAGGGPPVALAQHGRQAAGLAPRSGAVGQGLLHCERPARLQRRVGVAPRQLTLPQQLVHPRRDVRLATDRRATQTPLSILDYVILHHDTKHTKRRLNEVAVRGT